MATGVKSHGEYTVGWICALPKEQTAAVAMLDQIHPELDKPPNDHNAYTLGSIGEHNIVIACLPKGKIGTNSAATVATRMVDTFPSIKVGLMVGIGGGIPPKVRLGDVVVSAPVDEYPGVVQWDLGKAEKDGKFRRTGALNNPPSALLTAMTKLETSHEMSESKINDYLDEVEKKWPKLARKYTSPGSLKDPLFASDDDDDQQRKEVRIHYGLIASGNQVIKDSEFRDSLNDSFGGNVLCVEMEAAGLVNEFPCIVIRGICDYADSQKNKDWQEYAAMIAAGCAKELLGFIRPTDIHAERPVRDLLHNINTNVENIESKLERKEDLSILKWLLALDYASQQSDFINRRQPGTGQWLLDSEEYRTWTSKENQTLFCTGIPGAGKTILSSIVVNDLMKRATNDPTIAVAYIYFNFKREKDQMVTDLLRSILGQFLRGSPSLPKFAKDLYEQIRKNGTHPSTNEVLAAVCQVKYLYPRTFIVIDALDECQTSDGCRSEFTECILALQNRGYNLFVTSRHVPDIERCFEGCPKQEILASDDDVRRYLSGHMSDLPRFVIDNLELQERIKSEIVQAAEGMFLLAQLYLDSLKDKTSKREINDALKEFKKRQYRELGSDYKRELLDKAYDEAMERINSQMGGMRRLGRKVLAWITCAMRPLSAVELQHGLAVEIGDTEFDDDNIRAIEMIRSVCAGLVIVDDESGTIRLVHYTTQEYFDTRQESLFHDEKVGLAMACVTYLSFDAFGTGSCGGIGRLTRRLQRYPFYDYAAKTWGLHVRDVAIENHELIIDLLMDKAKSSSASQVLITTNADFANSYDTSDNSYRKFKPGYGLGIHIAASFGLGEAVMTLIKNGEDPNVRDAYGRTPLACAAARRYNEVVKLLLTVKGIDPNARGDDMVGSYSTANQAGEWLGRNPYSERLFKGSWYSNRCGGTPLFYAALYGTDEVVKTLLDDSRVDPNARDYAFGATPLWCAAGNGHESTVELLLKKPAVDPDSRDDNGDHMSPLSIAAWRGHTAVVKLLLATEGVDPESYDWGAQTPAGRAAWQGHGEVFDVLLEDGRIDPNAKDIRGFTALLVAAKQGNGNIIELLQSKGGDIDFNAPDKYSGTSPLQWTAREGREDAARVLLRDKRVDVNLRNNQWDYTALMFAAEKGHEEVVKVLLSAEGVNPNYADKRRRETALHYAVKRYNPKVISVLLTHPEIEPNLKDSEGMTPLMQAARLENEQGVLEAMLQSDTVDLDARTINGQTPLMLAAPSRRNKEMIELLLDKGADPDARDDVGRSLLFYLAKNVGLRSLERLISDERVELDLRDYYGSTPLSIAARFGNQELVKRFLATDKVDVNSKDNFGRTPLWWTTRNGHFRISELLLDYAEMKSISISDMICNVEFNGCSLKRFDQGLDFPITCSVCFLVVQMKERSSICEVCRGGDFNVCFCCYNMKAHCFDSQHELKLWDYSPAPSETGYDSSCSTVAS
ncbi:ankyrin repeat protein [Rostrohypoxylon terebratum]|nr:ankyrin repeat protein [Rostrohypoxylon terebratum]